MYWKDVCKKIRNEKACPFCELKFLRLTQDQVKEHLKNEHPEEMLNIFKTMTGCYHYCPFHRGKKHEIRVTCDMLFCPVCRKDLETWRINTVAGYLAKMCYETR